MRYNDDEETRIEKVKAKEVVEGGSRLDSEKIRTKSAVVKDIDDYGYDYVTATYDDEHWILGEEVHVVEANGDRWLRTDPNETPEDNLGSLPTF